MIDPMIVWRGYKASFTANLNEKEYPLEGSHMNQLVINQQKMAKVGEIAPDFILNNAKGETWCLSERREQVVGLLFYPKDETIICTKQMCSVRDKWAEYL